MKKRFKLLTVALIATIATASAITVTGCKKKPQEQDDGERYDAATLYAKAQGLGYDGSLEEFIATISGKDGTDGKDGTNGKDGKDGYGIKSGYVNEDGHLILIDTSDAEIDCGEIVHKHVFGDWLILSEQDCTQAGYKIRACECGFTQSEVTPAAGHGEFSYTKTETSHITTCGVCGNTEETEDHSYTDGTCECGFRDLTQVKFISPVEGAVMVRPFGYIQSGLAGRYEYHLAVDLSAESGAQVRAVSDGTVEAIIEADQLHGVIVKIDHGNGIKTEYEYVAIAEGLAVGSPVKEGDVIGTIDEPSGKETMFGIHLHFAVLNAGVYVDPQNLIPIKVEQTENTP